MTLRHAVKAGLVAAAVLLSGAGFAQAPDSPGAAGPEGMGPGRGFERLHKQLKLNPQQEDLWSKAQTAQRDAFKEMRTKGEETRTKLRAEIDKPGADLKQFAQLRDQMHEQMRTEMEASHKQVRAAWFSLYDSLDATQKEQVRVAIRDGMDRMGHHGKHPRGQRGGTQGQG